MRRVVVCGVLLLSACGGGSGSSSGGGGAATTTSSGGAGAQSSGGTTTTSGGTGGDTGGTTTSGGTGGVTGGTGGTGGVTGGTGGTGGVVTPCLVPADCLPPDSECQVATCIAGACGVDDVADGMPAKSQVNGDCQKNVCVGGAITSIEDATDIADDGKACTDNLCDMGMPWFPPSAAGTACVAANGHVCDGNGLCVPCVAPTDCPGSDTDCHHRTCTGAVCGIANTLPGTPVSSQTAGDCKVIVCDGQGQGVVQDDPNDVPNDNNPCTNDLCFQGAPTEVSVPNGTACGPSLTCVNGGCTGCASASDCPGVDDECKYRTCVAGACGTVYKASGTPVSTQTAGDCQVNGCDGAGGISTFADNNDVPVDNNICTADVCTAGVPSNPPVAADLPCNQNGGSVCSGTGSCVACNIASQCPGMDGECQVRACVAHNCTFANTASGTPVSAQVTGDCKLNVCDGSGGVTTAPQNNDLPVDGNQCTGDVCTAGVPSNPNLAQGAACSQNGGNLCNGAGACVVTPVVVSVSPDNLASITAVEATPITVTFSQPMNPATLVGQSAAGACTGAIQVSLDGFASCIALPGAPSMTNGNTTATLFATPGVLVNRTYKIRVTTAATSAVGIPLFAAVTQADGFSTTSPDLCAGSIVMAQVYGGGNVASATYKSDYVVLHNRGTTTVSIDGWSLQYAQALATTWTKTDLSGSIPAGGYFLIQESTGLGTYDLPGPDLIGTINMQSAQGKVALVSNGVVLSGACPLGGSVVDFVGYGAAGTVNCWEGTGPAPITTSSKSVYRQNNGCGDLDDNTLDFFQTTVVPLGSANSPVLCGCVTRNESNVAAEVDYCDVQFPTSLSIQTNASSGTVYGQVYELGVTPAAGAAAQVRAQLGYGLSTKNPELGSGFTWINATYNTQAGNNDEYMASFFGPLPGDYRYVYRMSLDYGTSWTVCDANLGPDFGAGQNAGLSFEIGSMPVLTVTP